MQPYASRQRGGEGKKNLYMGATIPFVSDLSRKNMASNLSHPGSPGKTMGMGRSQGKITIDPIELPLD